MAKYRFETVVNEQGKKVHEIEQAPIEFGGCEVGEVVLGKRGGRYILLRHWSQSKLMSLSTGKYIDVDESEIED